MAGFVAAKGALNFWLVASVLDDEDGKRRMTVTVDYGSLEVRAMVRSTGMERGAAISYDRLEDLVIGLRG